jgi:DtxR family Mn-dependent transcriptional regulator
MIHAAADEVLEHLWYAAEETRAASCVADLRVPSGESDLPDEALQCAVAELQSDGWIQPGSVWRLSPSGERRAQAIVRRHRLAEVLFVHAFGTGLREAEVSACEMEHMLSETVTNRICSFLGHPQACPHGKHIPQGECCGVYSTTVDPLISRLLDLPVGSTASIAYIAPKSSSRIERLAAFGIIPGSDVRLVARKPSCVISCGASSIALDDDIGRDIYVVRRNGC